MNHDAKDKKAKQTFITLAMFAHGYTSMLTNHYMEYNEALISEHLVKAYYGAAAEARKEKG